MTTRQLLGGMAASFTVPKLFAAFTRPLGAQLYTVRMLMPAKGAETLRAIAAIGYKEVEITLDDAKKYASVLKETGLKATATHLDVVHPHLDEEMVQAKELGIPAIGIAYVFPAERKDPAAFWPKYAEHLNEIGAKCKKAGLTFFYHHHNFEFDPKFRAIDVLHDKLSKDVKLEIDCFWASAGGEDPASLIEKWSDRIFALHLKDKVKGTLSAYEPDKAKHEDFLEVGAGAIDWPKVLKAAERAGVQHYYVEQDYTAGDPIESLRKSYNYLRKLS